MDTFFEQIISIKKAGKTFAALVGIWFLAFILSLVALLFLRALALIVVAGIIYGAYKLTGRYNVEFEYIITNGTMDIDKIMAKSSRKRVLSFDLSGVSRLEKYNPGLLNSVDKKSVLIACNEDSEGAYLMVSSREGKGTTYLVFAPDERLRGAIVKFLPKYISNSAFK